jgi:hypothetical protein
MFGSALRSPLPVADATSFKKPEGAGIRGLSLTGAFSGEWSVPPVYGKPHPLPLCRSLSSLVFSMGGRQDGKGLNFKREFSTG